MDMLIGVGFGIAQVTKDGEPVYDEHNLQDDDEYWTTQNAETAAEADPDHDWRIVLNGPLRGHTYQRHEPAKWVLVESNVGFA